MTCCSWIRSARIAGRAGVQLHGANGHLMAEQLHAAPSVMTSLTTSLTSERPLSRCQFLFREAPGRGRIHLTPPGSRSSNYPFQPERRAPSRSGVPRSSQPRRQASALAHDTGERLGFHFMGDSRLSVSPRHRHTRYACELHLGIEEALVRWARQLLFRLACGRVMSMTKETSFVWLPLEKCAGEPEPARRLAVFAKVLFLPRLEGFQPPF